jgi:hypothetical protein
MAWDGKTEFLIQHYFDGTPILEKPFDFRTRKRYDPLIKETVGRVWLDGGIVHTITNRQEKSTYEEALYTLHDLASEELFNAILNYGRDAGYPGAYFENCLSHFLSTLFKSSTVSTTILGERKLLSKLEQSIYGAGFIDELGTGDEDRDDALAANYPSYADGREISILDTLGTGKEHSLAKFSGDPPEFSQERRCCAVCGQILSGYNMSDRCWHHSTPPIDLSESFLSKMKDDQTLQEIFRKKTSGLPLTVKERKHYQRFKDDS